MELTSKNFSVYAAHYYDNMFCLTEDEFLSDLRKMGTLTRMMCWEDRGESSNIKLLVNNTISIYNVFDHHAASQMIEFKLKPELHHKMNSILFFLSLPLIGDGQYDIVFHRKVAKEYRQ